MKNEKVIEMLQPVLDDLKQRKTKRPILVLEHFIDYLKKTPDDS